MKKLIIKQFNINGKELESITISQFSKTKIDLKTIFVAMAHNSRQKSSSPKSRSEVVGSNKKPWRQKGTGKARAGSAKSPLWVGGGVTFAPKNIKIYKKINARIMKLAKKQLFQDMIMAGQVICATGLSKLKPKTKEIYALLKKINLDEKKVLILTDKEILAVKRASQNLAKVLYRKSQNTNILEMAKAKIILASKQAIDAIIK
ncbi:50S ribosomal protein L4 [Candidatus Berkelbacteria bacterium CG_4_9_14_3_um_filter_39_23]|uniref:Large ribosomal subunit protein uL4 n=2 Tax=Candidatus Berkelbacteria TaxID=1618330 RepID=A0A2M7CJ52_9BACT|nr:MAG: 50S ribosomal protein L4 [Candidatus Berkelbacteria bacterium CG03_land_8_20_14_0_80_40_36]PJB51497.1 MAG: 50S ribosomal protein L4 [Candidatus Berkelbacteria bacterium CG_4_9_14_3_um_filter_39_23]